MTRFNNTKPNNTHGSDQNMTPRQQLRQELSKSAAKKYTLYIENLQQDGDKRDQLLKSTITKLDPEILEEVNRIMSTYESQPEAKPLEILDVMNVAIKLSAQSDTDDTTLVKILNSLQKQNNTTLKLLIKLRPKILVNLEKNNHNQSHELLLSTFNQLPDIEKKGLVQKYPKILNNPQILTSYFNSKTGNLEQGELKMIINSALDIRITKDDLPKDIQTFLTSIEPSQWTSLIKAEATATDPEMLQKIVFLNAFHDLNLETQAITQLVKSSLPADDLLTLMASSPRNLDEQAFTKLVNSSLPIDELSTLIASSTQNLDAFINILEKEPRSDNKKELALDTFKKFSDKMSQFPGNYNTYDTGVFYSLLYFSVPEEQALPSIQNSPLSEIKENQWRKLVASVIQQYDRTNNEWTDRKRPWPLELVS